ncbi:hypothetical protein B6D60_02065, partial [candidate division KSB1 bacterium 4484_87]
NTMLQHGGVIKAKRRIAASAAYKIIKRRLTLNNYNSFMTIPINSKTKIVPKVLWQIPEKS